MNRIYQVKETLEMMGYDVKINYKFLYIRVFLIGNYNAYHLTASFDELNDEFCVEKIVNHFNKTIKDKE